MTTEELQTPIGNEEAIKLKPMNVIVKEVSIEEVGLKKSKKVVCLCMHPDTQDPIKISEAKWENKGKLEVTGLWYNVDSKKMIRKGSALANFMQANGAKVLGELVNKSIPTLLDDKGYLAFKNY